MNEDWLKQMRPRNWEQVWAEPVAARPLPGLSNLQVDTPRLV